MCMCASWGGGEIGRIRENALLPLTSRGKINQHRRLKNVKMFSQSLRFLVVSVLWCLWMCLAAVRHIRPAVQSNQQIAPGIQRAPLLIFSSSSLGSWTLRLECSLYFYLSWGVIIVSFVLRLTRVFFIPTVDSQLLPYFHVIQNALSDGRQSL